MDIISKNGNMLLNVLQRPDGSIDDETVWILEEIARWMAVCGEACMGPVRGEFRVKAIHRTIIRGFTEEQATWTPSDYRFTRKGNTVYAFMMRTPENRTAVIKSFLPQETVKSVRLLGEGSVPFAQNFGVLTVRLAEKNAAGGCQLPGGRTVIQAKKMFSSRRFIKNARN